MAADSANQSPIGMTQSSNLPPAEVARAVCGYLTSVGCPSSRSNFIQEHAELKDFNDLAKRGVIRSVDTDVDGMVLYDIVNEYVM